MITIQVLDGDARAKAGRRANGCIRSRRFRTFAIAQRPGTEMKVLPIWLAGAAMLLGGSASSPRLSISTKSTEACVRPVEGGPVPEPEDLRSTNGVLRAELRYRNFVDRDGHVRYCYLSQEGSEAPNLRVHPGDMVILSLKNEIAETSHFMHAPCKGAGRPDGFRGVRQFSDDGCLDKSSFSRADRAARLPPG